MSAYAEAVSRWQSDGFAFLPSLLPAAQIEAAKAGLVTMYPTAEQFHADPDAAAYAGLRDEFGGIRRFPFPSVDLCLLAVHESLIDLAAALLGTDDLRIYTIETWAKYSGAAEYEQWHHRDYLNHTPLVPSDDPRFAQAELWVYLSDVTDDHAPTRFVPRSITHPVPALPHAYGPTERPDWYDREVAAPGPAGSVLAYGVDTFHRAVPLRASNGARFTMQVNFRAGANEWMTRHSWGDRSFDPHWAPFVESVDPSRLSLFGFPAPGHPYWTRQTLNALAGRYPNLDTSYWS
jgi:hypothetical protein